MDETWPSSQADLEATPDESTSDLRRCIFQNSVTRSEVDSSGLASDLPENYSGARFVHRRAVQRVTPVMGPHGSEPATGNFWSKDLKGNFWPKDRKGKF